MLGRINTFLSPLTKNIKKYRVLLGWDILALAVISLPFAFDIGATRWTGEQALHILWFLLFLPIFSRVFGLEIAQVLMPLRKELGILSGTLALVHGLSYVIPDPTYILTSDFWVQNGSISYLAYGFLGWVIMVLLLITSNIWSKRFLGTKWKKLHRFVYGVVILTVIHVVVLRMDYGQVVLLVVYFLGKTLEWTGFTFKKKQSYPRGKKWLCVPCGYIYDPTLGDEDSGIAPGTEFTDIPETWRCPVCGVTKADFIIYEEGSVPETKNAILSKLTFLNPKTLEVIIETADRITGTPGQFFTFFWEDTGGIFQRSYSLAKQDGKYLMFLIKLKPQGRGSQVLQNIAIGSKILYNGGFGNFHIQNTSAKKIFLATGTGLAPIYSMITSLPDNIPRALYFSVSTGDDLFYREELQSIPNLDLHIHVTREDVEGCETGRVIVADIPGDPDTEWYICGNPMMLKETKEILQSRGFSKIYSEEF